MRLLACALAIAGCTSSVNPAELKPKWKNYLTEEMRKGGWRDIRTDEDSRARAPTKYAEATKGLVFSLRHAAKMGDTPGTICTWAFDSRSSREASMSGPFNQLTDDLNRENKLYKVYRLDEGDLHLLLYMESPSLSLANQFQLLDRAVHEHLADL